MSCPASAAPSAPSSKANPCSPSPRSRPRRNNGSVSPRSHSPPIAAQYPHPLPPLPRYPPPYPPPSVIPAPPLRHSCAGRNARTPKLHSTPDFRRRSEPHSGCPRELEPTFLRRNDGWKRSEQPPDPQRDDEGDGVVGAVRQRRRGQAARAHVEQPEDQPADGERDQQRNIEMRAGEEDRADKQRDPPPPDAVARTAQPAQQEAAEKALLGQRRGDDRRKGVEGEPLVVDAEIDLGFVEADDRLRSKDLGARTRRRSARKAAAFPS